jgi:tryptophan synthase alpha chain
MTARMDKRFADLKAEGRPALVTYFMGGDPDYDTSLGIMKALPDAGSDIIELGMPFSDPMADGPAIQLAGQRALKAGQTLKKTLQLAADFRKTDDKTPIVMMGYYNPIYIYGVETFLDDAIASGIDGLIVVDLPPEMDDESSASRRSARASTSFAWRRRPPTKSVCPPVLKNTSGFVYYVSMNGITGSAMPIHRWSLALSSASSSTPICRLRRLRHQDGRACKGHRRLCRWRRGRHGNRQPGRLSLSKDGKATADTVQAVATLVRGLSSGTRSARLVAAE